MTDAPVILVMGPAGSGKSHIGAELASALGIPFLDADTLHSAAARAKMAGGQGLTDDDRAPWLARIAEVLAGARATGAGLVIACSALKRAYRDQFRASCSDLFVVELEASAEVLGERIRSRSSHFVSVDLLPSQLADLEHLEKDERGARIDGTQAPAVVVAEAIRLITTG